MIESIILFKYFNNFNFIINKREAKKRSEELYKNELLKITNEMQMKKNKLYEWLYNYKYKDYIESGFDEKKSKDYAKLFALGTICKDKEIQDIVVDKLEKEIKNIKIKGKKNINKKLKLGTDFIKLFGIINKWDEEKINQSISVYKHSLIYERNILKRLGLSIAIGINVSGSAGFGNVNIFSGIGFDGEGNVVGLTSFSAGGGFGLGASANLQVIIANIKNAKSFKGSSLSFGGSFPLKGLANLGFEFIALNTDEGIKHGISISIGIGTDASQLVEEGILKKILGGELHFTFDATY